MRKFIALVSFTLVSVVGYDAVACSCAPPRPVKEELASAAAAFTGDAILIKKVAGETFPTNEVTFQVVNHFKGAPVRVVKVRTAIGGAACGYPFQTNKRYLVYAYADAKGVLHTGICSRTKPFEKAKEDLAALGKGYPPSSFTDLVEEDQADHFACKCPPGQLYNLAQRRCFPARPTACAEVYMPVCGCDGRTYGNACDARNAGLIVWRDGRCQ